MWCPEGYLLISDLRFRTWGNAGRVFLDRMPDEWLNERRGQRETISRTSRLVGTFGSADAMMEAATREWVFRTLISSEQVPVYICSLSGSLLRAQVEIFSSTETKWSKFWEEFNPLTATLDDFAKIFSIAVLDRGASASPDVGIVREEPIQSAKTWPYFWRKPEKKDNILLGEALQRGIRLRFAGWSVCFKESDLTMSAEKALDAALALSGFSIVSTSGASLPRPIGRPSVLTVAAKEYREKYPNGLKGVSLSEAARTVGYDRKTLRRAIELMTASETDLGN